jgi:threonine dehydratase
MDELSLSHIMAAATRIAPHVRRTPTIDIMVPSHDTPVTLKLEQLQHSGSFKARGAFNTLLKSNVPKAGVAAASGGNHGAAVAYAAHMLGIKARIFVPSISSPAKVARIANYGADIVQDGENYAAALLGCQTYQAQSGAMGIHAYDAIGTLQGQATVGLELKEQAQDLDTVLVAVGGGGLIGGIAAFYESSVNLVGVEPETANALDVALRAGTPTKITPSGIAADSLGASSVGDLMFPIAREHIASVALVTDAAIQDAQRYLWQHLQLVTEPGGAAAFAALLSGRYHPKPGERIGVIVCGANTPLETFAKLFS